MKIQVKAKTGPMKRKPGQLLATHIRYGDDGKSASVTHDYEPEPPKEGQMWRPPEGNERHFSTRIEAHHHAATHAGVPATMDDDEDDNQPTGGGGGTAGLAGLPPQQ